MNTIHNNILNDLQNGLSFKDELNKNYKNNEGKIEIDRFINDLQSIKESLGEKKLMGRISFISLKDLSINDSNERKIFELGLELILKKEFGIGLQEIDAQTAYKISKCKETFGNFLEYLCPERITPEVLKALIVLIQAIPSDYSTNFTTNDMLNYLLQKYKEVPIPPDQRKDAFLLCLSLFNQNYAGTIHIYNAFAKIPADQRKEVFDLAKPLSSRLSGSDVAEILKAIGPLPPDQRKEIVELATPFCSGKLMGYEIGSIIKSIAEIPKDERYEVVSLMNPFLPYLTGKYALQTTNIIKSVATIPANQREVFKETAELASPLFSKCNYSEEMLEITKSLLEIPSEERREVVDLANGLYSICSSETKISILLGIIDIPQESRDDVVTLSSIIFTNSSWTSNNIKNVLSDTYANIPREVMREKILLLDELDDLELNFIRNYLANVFLLDYKKWIDEFSILNLKDRDAMKEAAHLRLQQYLTSEEIYPEIKLIIAENIIGNLNELWLTDESPVFQTAIQTISICDPDTKNNPLNPYNLHKTLIETVPTEEWIPISNTNSWNLDTLRNKRSLAKYELEDLPKDVNENTLQNLFKALEDRIEQLSEEQRAEVEQYIISSTSDFISQDDTINEADRMDLQKLKSNLLLKPYIQNLLVKKENVTPSQFQLYAILKAILDKDNGLKPGELLSPREEMLLKMSASIQNCSTGQRDGIKNYFLLLPEEYRTKMVEEDSNIVGKLVDENLQKEFHDVISNEVTQKLAPGTKEPSHVTLYLENRFCKQLGLAHEITFDPHTMVLPKNLVALNPKDVIEACLHYLNPEKVAKKIMLDSENSFKQKGNHFYDKVIDVIENTVGKLKGDDFPRYIEFDQNTYAPIRLTEEGAIVLLKAMKYLS